MTLARQAQSTLLRLSQAFRVVAITGPRQSGKTTLAQLCFPEKPYLSLEDLDVRHRAQADPRGFLAQFPQGAVLDEVQRLPDLLSYLQGVVDQRQRMGDFVLTGSEQFGLRAGISQSLAGRVAHIELLPLSLNELAQTRQFQDLASKPSGPNQALMHWMWQGSYPALYAGQAGATGESMVAPYDWYAQYLATYVQRDVRQITGVQDLAAFERFVLLCAGRCGQLLNMSSLASDAGVSANTAKHWISVLQASYIIRLLEPWHENFGKRLVKMPKLYFLDTGLLCHLLRIESPAALAQHALRGAVFESWVLAETLKHRLNQGLRPDIYFWRDNHGTEVDLLYPHGDLLYPVEIKSGQTFSPDWLSGIDKFRRYAGPKAGSGAVVYGGEESFSFKEQAIYSWQVLGQG